MSQTPLRKLILFLLCTALMCMMAVPAYAFLSKKERTTPAPSELTRSVVFGQTLSFSADDFALSERDQVTITTLPTAGSGILSVGGQPVESGAVIHAQAMDGLQFQPSSTTTATTASFTVTPTFFSGDQGTPVTVSIHLLSAPNQAPIAKNLTIKTYRNVAIEGRLQATDADNEPITFQLTSSPARGSVALNENNLGGFTYTPYENKTGKDSFTYVAVDSAGNISNTAKVSIRIEKADTAVTYADMDGHPAHHAAIRLAEADLLVGSQINGHYFFSPNAPISRSQFLSLAMSVADVEPLKQVSLTGFCDDETIPTWSKGYVSSALMAGAVSGMRNELGQAVFCPEQTITRGEATAMLDRLLNVSDVAVESWSAQGISHDEQTHWAMQSAADLTCAGVLTLEDTTPQQLDAPLTRADAAQLLSDSLDLLNNRKGGLFG